MDHETAPRLRTIAELNQLAPSEFAAALRPLFEAAGPLAEALHAERPFVSYPDLLDRAESVAGRLAATAQIEVVSAHPRIGESADAVRQTSALSYREQGYADEAALPSDEVRHVYAALAQLNQAYEERFGFRFVVFVNGRPKAELVKVLEERLRNAPEIELRAALQAMFLIARDRYQSLARTASG
ncbi:MAG TPA: 2-oxo-4-hydroxy-4-carboxy-5-ureidoimidazoline decarboxylase [Chloroflexota bacterium]|nr:2-oxo-4-hydroxy-4-carboxy-5-ureidoimidazoline decarboxylase [Chloroflexota bacterium]